MTAVLEPTAGVDIAGGAVERALASGADDAQVVHAFTERFEITYDNEEVGLVRTTVDDQISLTLFVGGAKGQSSLTGRSPDLVRQAVDEALGAARAGVSDPANRITTGESTPRQERGDAEPDREAMLDTAMRHIAFMAEHYPKVLVRDSTYEFNNVWRSFANSAGRTHQERRAGYTATSIFSAKDAHRSTSFNFTSATSPTPFTELIEMATLRRLLDESMASFDPRPVPETFTGDVIFTPDSLDTLVGPVLQAIGGYQLMRGTSPYADSIGQAIASPSLTITNRPRSDQFPLAASFDGDGVPSVDLPVVTQGVLKHHLIDWYVSNKLGEPMTAGVHHIDVAPGEQSFEEIVAGTKRGIVLGRFSGGRPNQKLDFSGVAKNSFYVEDGEVVHPIHETMIAGNFGDLLRQIRAVGSESVNYGGHAFPAVAVSGATISRK